MDKRCCGAGLSSSTPNDLHMDRVSNRPVPIRNTPNDLHMARVSNRPVLIRNTVQGHALNMVKL